MLQVPVRWKWAAPAILLPLVFAGSWIFHRASQAHDQAAAESLAATQIPATFDTLPTQASITADVLSATPAFHDAAVWQGKVYLCGPGEIHVVHSEESPAETFRVGRELPAGELTALGASATELFIATKGAGLLVYNGTRFRQLLPNDVHLKSFTSVLALPAGRVLLGTPDRGVLAWDGKVLNELLPDLKNAHVTALAGSDADLWIGTLADGVWRLHAGQLDKLSSSLPDPHVLSLAVLGLSAYAGTPVGVVEFHDGRKTRNLAEGYFARSLQADSESLVVGTEDEGIVTVPLHAPLRRTLSVFPVSAPVERILQFHNVRYALAGALFRSETPTRTSPSSTWTRVVGSEKGVLSDRNISSLSVGHDGRVWIGYFDHGLDVADAPFGAVKHFEDEHLFCVNRIAEEPGGARTAIATANGLVMIDPALTVRQVLGRKDGLLADHVTDVVFRPGGIVIATPAGLSLVSADGVHSLYVLQGLVNNHVYALASAGDRVAAGTLGGLSVLDHDVVMVNYTTANSGLKHNWISALAHVGEDWFAGTYGAGVMRLDHSGHWSGFPDMKGSLEVNPNAMAQVEGALYMGSLGRGLWVYSRGSGRWRNVISGLPSLNVTAVAAGNGYVYVGTDNGLVRFHEGNLQ